MGKHKHKLWDSKALVSAVNAVKEKKMGYRAAAKFFKVSRIKLISYVKSGLPSKELVNVKKNIGWSPVLTHGIEETLVEYCLIMKRNFYGLTSEDMSRIAYQLNVRNNLSHPSSTTSQDAGKKWKRLFLERHPSLGIKPEDLSKAQIQGFTKENKDTFFSILKSELQKINFDANKIFNVDASRISVSQDKSVKIIVAKSRKQVQELSSAEHGVTVTIITCVSAAGQYVPPMLIFPQKKWQHELLNDAPPGSIGACSRIGWINAPLFVKWLEHFINITKPTKESPVVLILNGHYSHIRNVDVIDRARETGVSIVCFPPHSTNKMQPLDVSFMLSLKTYYASAIENWLANHPNRTVRKSEVASLFAEAYNRSATMENALSGFSKTGISPFNPNIFTDADFVCQQQIQETVEKEQISNETSDYVTCEDPSTSTSCCLE